MKSLLWAMLAAFFLGIPIGYGGLFLVSSAIGAAKAKLAVPPATIFYVERTAPRASPLAPSPSASVTVSAARSPPVAAR